MHVDLEKRAYANKISELKHNSVTKKQLYVDDTK